MEWVLAGRPVNNSTWEIGKRQKSEVRGQKGKRKKFWVLGFELWMEEKEGEKIRRWRTDVRRARDRDRDPQIIPVQFSEPTGQAQIDADEGKKKFRDELFELAICDFRLNLEKLRKLYPVKTICMHGSSLSKWDNRD